MEQFLVENPMYVVFAIVFVIWVGIAWYLFALNKRVAELERTVRRTDRT